MESTPDPKRSFGLSGRVSACVAVAFALSGVGYVGFVAPAQAAVVSYDAASSMLSFTAHAGEANIVEVEYWAGEAVISDTGAPLEAGAGCEQIDASSVICGSGESWFDLGDGNDWMQGGNADETIRGGPGQDRISGGPGADALFGGRGWDTLSYLLAPRGVSVDLTTGTARGWGLDRLRGFEGVSGSDFADVLVGDQGRNTLQGWAGNDRIHGRGGSDYLRGQLGDDALFARDGRRDWVEGNRGVDRACVDRRLDQFSSIARFSCRL